MTNVLNIEGMSCEALYKMFTSYVESLQELISDAKTVLRNIKSMVQYPFKRLLAIIDEYASALGNLEFLDLSDLNKVINALKKMMDCPYLAQTVGSQVESILNSVGQGKRAIMKMVQDMVQGIVDRIKASIEPIRQILNNPIDKAIQGFDKFINNGPVKSALAAIAQIQECLGNMCAAYKAVKNFSPGTIIKPLEAWGVKYENGSLDCSGVKNALKDKCTDIKNNAKKSWEKSKDEAIERLKVVDKKISSVEKRIKTISGSASEDTQNGG